jgi:hypothetical protein
MELLEIISVFLERCIQYLYNPIYDNEFLYNLFFELEEIPEEIKRNFSEIERLYFDIHPSNNVFSKTKAIFFLRDCKKYSDRINFEKSEKIRYSKESMDFFSNSLKVIEHFEREVLSLIRGYDEIQQRNNQLFNQLKDKSLEDREESLKEFVILIESHGVIAIQQIIKELNMQPAGIKRDIFNLLFHLGKESDNSQIIIEELIHALTYSSLEVKWLIIQTLGRLNDKRAITALQATLSDTDFLVKYWSIISLKCIQGT